VPVLSGLLAAALVVSSALRTEAEDISAPAILQWFQADYDVMIDRSADMFLAGYGAVWMPPPGRGDANQTGSVGYDVYDRFDLGKPRYETAYGTETGLKQFADVLHRFDGRLHIDAVLNHNGYSENDYSGTQYTQFRAAGGYPGFMLENPDGGTDPNGVPGTYGDFYDPTPSSPNVVNTQLAGLLDIDHTRNHQKIRHPVAAGNAQNIPAGTTPWAGRLANVPDAANARFYPDRDLASATYTDNGPNGLGQSFTIYPFNAADAMQGDAVPENSTGLLMRYLQWMVQEVGVDGFRLDAAKHMDHFALKYMDAAVYRSNPRLLLDGSVDHVFMYGETVPGDGQEPGQDQWSFMQEYIRKDINPAMPNQIGGNRDTLDFALRGRMNDELSSNGFANDFRDMVNSSMDVYSDGLHNGLTGVQFVSNHDGGGAAMNNVAHAYILTQPGNAIVYHNAHQFTGFPQDGRGDALGNYGDTITDLVNIRNTHGRGNYRERWLEKEYFAMERSGSMLVALANHGGSGVSGLKTMNTDFASDTRLVELTGNAAAYNATSPPQTLPLVLTVNTSQQVSLRFLHNDMTNPDISRRDRGYLIYGLQPPKSAAGLVVTNASGVLEGGPVTAGSQFLNGKDRLADLQVVTADQINVRVDTQAVTLPDGFRDVNADGDNAVLRVNNGMDTNGNGQIDYRTPGSVVYGFEEFTAGNKSPGFGSPTGDGWYQESINATNLPEGYNFITVRVFRKGAGGPTVFNDFRQVVYLDRLDPVSAVVSFAPFASDPGNPNNRDLIVRSVDQTANNMHFLLDQPASLTDAQILALVTGSNQASYYDRDQFIRGYNGVTTGNHVVTVVSYEPTGNYNIQRFAGMFTDTNIGLGFGDMNSSGAFSVSDILCSGACSNFSAEDILYSQNTKFRAQFDVNGDGLGDNRDLFALGDELVSGGAGQSVLDAYTELLLKRADVDSSTNSNIADIAALYASFGSPSWLTDINVDGLVDIDDVATMITELFRTVPGDFNLDGVVDARDYIVARKGVGAANALFTQGDADLDRDVDNDDLALWQNNFGFVRLPIAPGGGGSSGGVVPEPSGALLFVIAACATALTRRPTRTLK
jgi:glycosidase